MFVQLFSTYAFCSHHINAIQIKNTPSLPASYLRPRAAPLDFFGTGVSASLVLLSAFQVRSIQSFFIERPHTPRHSLRADFHKTYLVSLLHVRVLVLRTSTAFVLESHCLQSRSLTVHLITHQSHSSSRNTHTTALRADFHKTYLVSLLDVRVLVPRP
jgi:hypothetical protein